jgi:type I restriction enzyme S subunit
VEPAEKLLQRIRAERRRRWEEAELTKLRAKGKAPGDDRWKDKYAEPEPVDGEGLPELPAGWAWASLAEVTLNFDGDRIPLKLEDRGKRAGEFAYYGASGIIDTIDAYLFDGDFLLIAEDGANLLSRSSPIAFAASGRFWVNNHAHVVKPVGAPMAYVREYLNGIDLAQYVTGSAQPKLTQKNMNAIPVPIAPNAEAERIARSVDKAVTSLGVVIQHREGLLESLTALDRAILAKAFRGDLVPQDPADEPASVLLDRIRRERAEATDAGARKPRTPRKGPAGR